MRVAIISDTFFPGQVNGVAKVAFRQAKILEQRGHEVRVWSVHNTPSLPFFGYKGERLALPLGQAWREIKQFRPEVIHAHTPFVLGWEGVLAAASLGVPLVGTHHTFFDHYLEHVHLDSRLSRYLSWKYLNLHYNRYDLVLSPSEALLLGMKEHGLSSDVRVLPNGVDTDFFRQADEHQYAQSVVYMGRLSYEKSIHKVIEAFALVGERYPDATLTIIGDGPERPKLETLVKKLGLDARVHFTGMLHDEALVEALQAADVFVTASKSENMPLSVLEAMAVGLPVVGVDALGLPEIIVHGVNGFLAQPDNAQEIAERIGDIFEDEVLRKSLGQAARDTAMKKSEAEQARMLEEIYTSLI